MAFNLTSFQKGILFEIYILLIRGDYMRKSLGYGIMLFCVFAAGCMGGKANRVKVEPAVFNHPDEMKKDDGFMVLADRRVFAVMTFLNAAGYDEEVTGRQMHPIRVKVRKLVADNLASSPEKLRYWRDYYKSKRMGSWQYADFALSLSSDYPFRRIRSDKELGYKWTAWELADFPEVLNDFWITAKLDDVWDEVKGDYIKEIDVGYDLDRMKKQMSFLWNYLKMQRNDKLIIVQVPNPLERHATASGAKYENYFYSIDGPGSSSNLNIHEYLHTIINPIVKADVPAYKSKLQQYYKAGKDAPISKSYQDPVIFTYECLVHAIDTRLIVVQLSDAEVKKRVEDKLMLLTRDGYTLSWPFYLLLADYEKSDKNFKQYMPVMFENLPQYSP